MGDRLPIDREFTLGALRELVRIDSRNPALEEGAPGEREAALYVHRRLREVGWAAELQEIGGGRANVVARRPGSGGGRSLMVNVHLDTVGVAGMAEPFSGELREGRIWGRGAQDIKSGAAAALGVARALAEEEVELAGDLVLAFVADEENDSLGTEALLSQVMTDAAVVLEPSDLALCVAHRGFGIFRVACRGRVAHGGRSDVGRDANLALARVLVEIGRLRERWDRHRHPMLGTPALHVPLLTGGHQLFIYAGEAVAHVECRTVPGQTSDAVTAELRAAIDSAGRKIEDLEASVELRQWREPFEIDPAAPIARTVLDALAGVRGVPREEIPVIGHPWWEDSALLAAAGIDTVVVGPVGDGLHSEREWVDADSVIDLARVLRRTALAFCGTGGPGTAGHGEESG